MYVARLALTGCTGLVALLALSDAAFAKAKWDAISPDVATVPNTVVEPETNLSPDFAPVLAQSVPEPVAEPAASATDSTVAEPASTLQPVELAPLELNPLETVETAEVSDEVETSAVETSAIALEPLTIGFSSTSPNLAEDLFNTEPRGLESLPTDPVYLSQLPNPFGIRMGWYVSASPSLVFGYDVDADSVTIPALALAPLPPGISSDSSVELDTQTGFGLSGAVGYRFSVARAELELTYNNNEIDDVTLNSALIPGGTLTSESDGSIDNFVLMLNGYFDVPTRSRLRPYIGGGAGVAILSVNDLELGVPGLPVTTIDDSEVALVFQGKAGVTYHLAPFTHLFLGYRLFIVPGQNFELDDVEFDADSVFIHTIQAGVRLQF